MASAIEPLVSTEIHRILKAEWLTAYIEARHNAFSIQNIQSGFSGTGILPFDPSKVVNRIKPVVQNSIVVRAFIPTDFASPFKESVLTNSPLNTEEARTANAALLGELASGAPLSTPARNYMQKVVKRSERVQARNIIIEQEHEKLREVVTKRKAILVAKGRLSTGSTF
jgi:hypothetical protein